jgi:hypothetical protein
MRSHRTHAQGHVHLSELHADDLLLDRLATRADAGSEPVIVLLSALSRHAETPLRPARSERRFRRHRALTAMAAVVIGASGVGAAAAVTQPGRVWHPRDSLRMTDSEAGAAAAPSVPSMPSMPSMPLPAPRISAAAPESASGAYALVRDAAGRIVAVRSGAVAARGPAASTRQAAQAPVAASGAAAQVAAGATRSIREAEEPHLSFFLAIDPDPVEAGRPPRLVASSGRTKPLTADDSADDTTTSATSATSATTTEPATVPRLSAGGGASSRPVLPAGDVRPTPAEPPAAAPEALPSETPSGTSPTSGTSETSTSATPEQPSQEADETDAPAETPSSEPVP